MSSQKETHKKIAVMQHYADGGRVLQSNGNPVNVPLWDWLGNDYIIDDYSSLRVAVSEGALIEKKVNGNWIGISTNTFLLNEQYRIKGDISIHRWNQHKEAIKAFWETGEVECSFNFGEWRKSKAPNFYMLNYEYRRIEKETVMTINEIEKILGVKNLKIKGE